MTFVNLSYWAGNLEDIESLHVEGNCLRYLLGRNLSSSPSLGSSANCNITFEKGLIKTAQGPFKKVQIKKIKTETIEMKSEDGDIYCLRFLEGRCVQPRKNAIVLARKL
jgi:hypothetical protein